MMNFSKLNDNYLPQLSTAESSLVDPFPSLIMPMNILIKPMPCPCGHALLKGPI